MSDKGPIPPHSPESERALLGSILLAPDETLDLCRQHGLVAREIPVGFQKATRRVPEFYVPAHETIYLALLDMADGGARIDLITLTNELRNRGCLETVGGPVELTALINFVPSAANAEHYIDILRRKMLRREMIRQATEIVRRAYDDGNDENVILDQAQAEITELSEMSFKEKPVRQIAEDVDAVLLYAEEMYKRRGKNVIHGLPTGLIDLDRMTGGLLGGQLAVFAGRPGTGKSVIGMNIAAFVAGFYSVPVLYFSLEMSRDELVKRLFVAHAHLDRKFTEKFMRNGYFSDHERDFVIPKIAGELRHVPVMLDATAGLKIADFKARSRRAKVQTEGRLGLIVVDYLQLMKSSRREAQENRQAEIGEASLACKEIAKELNVPVIALAQLNRDTEKRAMHVPKLSDLRESGSIENDADFVGLLYRKYLYTKEPEDEGSATIMVQKHRNGPVGDVAMAFPEGAMRFENLALDDGRERPQWSNDPSKRQKRK